MTILSLEKQIYQDFHDWTNPLSILVTCMQVALPNQQQQQQQQVLEPASTFIISGSVYAEGDTQFTLAKQFH